MRREKVLVCGSVLALLLLSAGSILAVVRCRLDHRSNERRSLIPLATYNGIDQGAAKWHRRHWRFLNPAIDDDDDDNRSEPSSSFLMEEQQPANGTGTKNGKSNTDTTFSGDEQESDSSSAAHVTVTLMVAVSSASLACFVVACVLAMHTYWRKQADMFSTNSHSTTFEGSLAHRKTAMIALAAFPATRAFPRVSQTDESILDLTVYGNAELGSVSPLSSSMIMSSSSSSSSGSDELVPACYHQGICRESKHNAANGLDRADDQKSLLFVAHTAATMESSSSTDNASNKSSPETEVESRDDQSGPRCADGPTEASARSTDVLVDYVYDIFLADLPSSHRNFTSTNGYRSTFDMWGLVLEDPFCAVTHPVVIRISDESPLAGRLLPGDFILRINDTCLRGASSARLSQLASLPLATTDQTISTFVTKITVMTTQSTNSSTTRYDRQQQHQLTCQDRERSTLIEV